LHLKAHEETKEKRRSGGVKAPPSLAMVENETLPHLEAPEKKTRKKKQKSGG
jgi:hypothetical protein